MEQWATGPLFLDDDKLDLGDSDENGGEGVLFAEFGDDRSWDCKIGADTDAMMLMLMPGADIKWSI